MEICGILTAMNQIAIGYPMETIKIRSQARQCNLFMVYRNMSKEGGIMGLYRGCALPFLVQIIIQPVHIMTFTHLNEYMPASMAGACAGIGIGILTNPFEVMKSRIQNGIRQMPTCRYLVFRGMHHNVLRELVGSAVYWHIYDIFRDEWNPIHGGIAGVGSWLASYPFDVWKTRNQCGIENQCMPNFRYGLSITMVRAFIVNAINLTVFDYFQRRQE